MADEQVQQLDAVGRFGKRLRRAREARSLSLANVASTVGCSQQYLSLVEQGERAPDFALVSKLTIMFDLDLRACVYGQKVAGSLDEAPDADNDAA